MNKDFAEFHFSINYLTCMQYSILSTWSPLVLDTEYFEEGLFFFSFNILIFSLNFLLI